MDIGFYPGAPVSVEVERGTAPDGQAPPALRPHTANSYGLLRLVLASLVIIQHSLYLTGHEEAMFVGIADLGRSASYGDIAVAGFFALSGFLLATSVSRHTPRRFLRLRFHRLMPGFWAALLVVAFVLAPLIGLLAGTINSYAIVGSDSAVSYVVRNIALLITQPTIGGVLSQHPYPLSLDGSFWTLLPEFVCYVALLVVTLVAPRVRLAGWRAPAVVAAGAMMVFWFADLALPGGTGLLLSQLASLAAAFFTGSTLAALSWHLRVGRREVIVSGVATIAMLGLGLWLPFGPPVLAAFVVALGAHLKHGWPSRVGTRADLSYGVYLYHFPVIQLLIAAGVAGATVTTDLLVLGPLALLVTLPIAAASWFLVEAPAQRRGRRKPRPRTATPAR